MHPSPRRRLTARLPRPLGLALGLAATLALPAAPAEAQSSIYHFYSFFQEREALPGENEGDLVTQQWPRLCENATPWSCEVPGFNIQATTDFQDGVLSSYASVEALGAVLDESWMPEEVYRSGWGLESTIGITDQLVFTGSLPATLRFSWSLDGMVTNTNTAGSAATGLNSAGYTWVSATQDGATAGDFGGGYEITTGAEPTVSRSIAGAGVFDLAILSSDTVFLEWYVSAEAKIEPWASDAPQFGRAEGLVSGARLTVQALDAEGNDITAQAGLSFASGNSYGASVAPEPVSMALLGTGLAGVAALRRRRRRGDADEA